MPALKPGPARLTWQPAGAGLALLVATILRAIPLQANRFHPDEALYAYFARLIASGHDPLLAGVVVDKPPLAFYLTALSLWTIGPNELAARLPELLAGLTSVALLYALGRQLYGASVGHLAAWLLALSPFGILFSITAFVDPLLTAGVLWALLAASRGRWRSLALALALTFALKQTALLFLPLALALALLLPPVPASPRQTARRLVTVLPPLLLALAASALLVFSWDALRHSAIGFWSQGYADNVPGRLVRANELLPRALAWVNLLHYFTGSTSLNLLFGLCLPLLLLFNRQTATRAGLVDLLLAGFLLLYLAGYWLLAFNVWDRYLLPILPIWMLLMSRVLLFVAYALARSLHSLSQRWYRRARTLAGLDLGFRRTLRFGLPLGLCLLIAPPAVQAAHSRYPIGGDHGAYDGIDGAARFIDTLPQGSVLYDHWLSWEWNFYLYGAPVYVAWFPSPESLTTDLEAFGATSLRYLAVPTWEGEAEMRAAAATAGYTFVPLYTAYRRDGAPTIIVYALSRTQPALGSARPPRTREARINAAGRGRGTQ
jgi:hypothetical protein